MLAKLFVTICKNFPFLRRILWRQWYQFLARYFRRRTDWSFMNYGYAPLTSQPEKLELKEADESDRYCIQLYHHVASAVNIKNLNVLEVGSGRGGGASYIKRYLEPAAMTGVDLSEKAVALCNRKYAGIKGLSFRTGNAESLPFDNDSFDAIVNVESSHGYGSMEAFLAQVKRVLRSGGYFLFADLRDQSGVIQLREQIQRSGLTFIRETNITPNVFEALKLDNERKINLIKKSIPKLLLKSFREFAGVEGSRIYEGFRTGNLTYLSFVLQKP